MTTTVNPTLYDILGVPRDATPAQVKAAWRDAAERFEPGSGGSTGQFRLFNEAAEVLLDPERRKEYDEQLDRQRPPAPVPAADGAPLTVPDAITLPTTREPRGRRGMPIRLFVVLTVLTALAAGAALYLLDDYRQTTGYQQALDQAPASAERAAAAVLAYDYRSLEGDRDAAAKFLTPGYRDDYLKTFDSLVRDTALDTKATVKADVLASAAMPQSGHRDPDRVPVLLFVNQSTVSATSSSDRPNVALNRVRFDMVKVDGTWLVDGITSY